MDVSKGLLSNPEDVDAHWRYRAVSGCPSTEHEFVPEAFASAAYVSPWRMETMAQFNFSAMPLDAINRIGEFTKEEICTMTPSFCAYKDVAAGLDSVALPASEAIRHRRRRRRRRKGGAWVPTDAFSGVLAPHLITFCAGLIAGLAYQHIAAAIRAPTTLNRKSRQGKDD